MNKKPLLSFHGKQEIKDFYLSRLEAHAKADEIIQGTSWDKRKGCAVGCTLHKYDHMAYETELGIPVVLARLEDRIFEGMSNADAKTFPYEFLAAIPVGIDLNPVWKKFLIWLLIDAENGVIQYSRNDHEKEIVKHIAGLIAKSIDSEADIEALRSVARIADAYADADDAAHDAVVAAFAAYAVAGYDDAGVAGYYYPAVDAAVAAAAAADNTVAAAVAAAVADANTVAAYVAAYNTYAAMRKRLIELLKEAE